MTTAAISPPRSSLNSRVSTLIAETLRPSPTPTADRWADAHRQLPADAYRKGAWRTSEVPYLIDPAAALADPMVECVVLVTGSQMSKSEFALCALGWNADVRRVPALLIEPTEKLARTFARDRFDALVTGSPRLQSLMDPRKIGLTSVERYLAGTRIGFGWSSATELASHPAGLVVMDEVDKFPEDVDEQGDAVYQLQARLKTYADGVMLLTSSPTTRAGRVFEAWSEGTRRAWAWTCEDCGHVFVPQTRHVELSAAPVIACPGCGVVYDETRRKRTALAGGYVRCDFDDDGVFQPLDAPPPLPPGRRIESYWVTGYSSALSTLASVAAHVHRARQSGRPATEQAAINLQAGEIYEPAGESSPASAVADRREPYDVDPPPRGVRLITAGVDVQKAGIWYVIRGYGFAAESWTLQYAYLHGDTEYDSVWLRLVRVMEQRFGELPIKRVFIDSGYRPGDRHRRPVNIIYRYCRAQRRWSPTKSHDHQDRPHRAALIDTRRSGQTSKVGLRLWHLCSDTWKSWVYARLAWPRGEPGDWHELAPPDGRPDAHADYDSQATNEIRRIGPNGKAKWVVTGNRQNHILDCLALSAAAADVEGVQQLKPLPAPAPANAAPRAPRRAPAVDPSLIPRPI